MGPGIKGWKWGWHHSLLPRDPLAIFLLSVPTTLCSAGLQVLAAEGGMFPLGNTMILLNWKLRLPPGHFELLMPLNQQAKENYGVGWGD